MKQTKWLISLSACLVLMAASSAGVKGKLAIPCQAWEQGSIDTIPLPSRIYSIGKEVVRSSRPLRCNPSLTNWIRSERGRIPY